MTIEAAIMNHNRLLKIRLATFFFILFSSEVSHAQKFTPKHHHELISDGPDNGFDSYTLIRNALGIKAIESPDLYQSNHTEKLHIIEDEDSIVGPHFVFFSHLNSDADRDKGKTDRQRNEIKVYDKSNPELMGFEEDTMQYRWKFRIENDFEFSKNFTHFFQIKAKNTHKENSRNGGDGFPIITLTVADKGHDKNEFQLRYSSGIDEQGNKAASVKLIRKDMALLSGKWLEFFVQVTYQEKGNLQLIAKDVETNEVLIDFQKDNLDMWRGVNKADFARPKWGIYRSLKDKDSLRSNEESARFADFAITKGELN